MLNLRADLAHIGSNQSTLARHLGVSTATVSLAINYGRWPKHSGLKQQLQEGIRTYLLSNGATVEMAEATFNEAPTAPRANAGRSAMATATDSGPQPGPDHTEDLTMLLRHSRFTREARAHFRIARDPFVEEMENDGDVFLTDDIRYVRAAMRQTAKHGGMLAVIAESGGGKSTLRHDLLHWVETSGEPITTIQVSALGIDDAGERKGGRALTASDIIVTLVRALSPGAAIRQTLVDRSHQVETVLRNSAKVGRKHVLLIEEGHSLTKASIKQLKRFYELQDGFKKLLSIILVGQPELKNKLSETDPEVREVVQRMELVELPALDNHVEAYLRHKFARVELDYDKLCADDVAGMIRDRLRVAQTEYRGGQRAVRERSLCHPLAVNNLVTAAMNQAVKIGAPKVTGALIAAVLRAE